MLTTTVPVLQSVFYSFTNYKIVSGKWQWVELTNYVNVLTDQQLSKIIKNTLVFSGVSIPLSIISGLFIATCINQLTVGKQVYRTLAFLPVVIASSVSATVFSFLLNPKYGYFSNLIESMGGEAIDLLNNPRLALPTLIGITVWKIASYVFIFYSAALQGVNPHLIEASNIDGANAWKRYWHIVLPSMAKTHSFVFIIALTCSLQSFENIHILTQGGPNNHTNVLYYKIYQEGFNYYDMGRATALATIVLVIIGIGSLVRRLLRNKKL